MKFVIAILALAFAPSIVAAQNSSGNTGDVASHCVDIQIEQSQYDDTEYFNIMNTCNGDIFVIYCGDVVGSNNVCGGGNNSVYYTHSKVLRSGTSSEAAIRGNGMFVWGACTGLISFGNDGHFEDYPDGSYRCLPR